jgi:glycosyltransferase involved in cell wall biosynthesis
VCFVAPHTYPLFNPEFKSRFGGIEVQAYWLATELAQRSGFDVSFVVRNHGMDETEKIGGVTIVPYKRRLGWAYRYFSYLNRVQLNPFKDPSQLKGVTMNLLGDDTLRKGRDEKEGLDQEPELRGSGVPKKEELPSEKDDFWEQSRKSEIRLAQGKGRIVRLQHSPWTRPIYHVVIAGQAVVDFVRHLLPYYISRFFKSLILMNLYYLDPVPFYKHNYFYYLRNMFRYRTYEDMGADVYISFGMNNLTAELVAFTSLNKKKVILFAASDSDFSDSYFLGSNIRNYYGDVGDICHFAIMRADRIVAQNRHQKKMAETRFHRDSGIIPNPIDLSIQPNPKKTFAERKHVLWIGKADHTKQPQAFLALAKELPKFEFFMVLNTGRMAVEDDIIAHKPLNLTIVERVSHGDVPGLMENALVLVNSSRFEGFPNTFLEAGRAGTPILSLNVNPDGFITEYDAGICADGDINAFIEGCGKLAGDESLWNETSANALEYVVKFHDKAKCVYQLIDVIHSCVDAEDEPLPDIRRGGVNFEEFLRARNEETRADEETLAGRG